MNIQKEIKCVPARQSKRTTLDHALHSQALTPLPLPHIEWYDGKVKLLAAKTLSDKWIFTRDKSFGTGAKEYAWFSNATFDEFVSCPANNGHYYELILNLQDYPCYICMDIDRHLDPDIDSDICLNMVSYFTDFLALFESKFTSFIKHVYSHEIVLSMGQNYQVSTSHTNMKMSCHIKIDIPCKNLSCVKQVMLNFECEATCTTRQSNKRISSITTKRNTFVLLTVQFTPTQDPCVFHTRQNGSAMPTHCSLI